MRRIKLHKYGYALVDDEDYEYLNQFKWHLTARGYVGRSVWVKGTGKGTTILMHRELLKVSKGFEVEHADQNRLNNQKSNLRPATRSQNMANVRRVKATNAHSKYKGVSRLTRPNLKNQWLAYIKIDYQMIYIGYFKDEKDAAHCYNQFAEQLYDNFACPNDIV